MDWLKGFGWGAISAVSLPLGAWLGINFSFAQEVRAAMMAFGAGALLFASALELFGEALHHASSSNEGVGPLYVMVASALFGGAFFEFVNSIVEDQGAFYRKLGRVRMYFDAAKRNMLQQLSTYPILQVAVLQTTSAISTQQ